MATHRAWPFAWIVITICGLWSCAEAHNGLDEDGLRASFVQRIQSIAFVENFAVQDDIITFTREDGAGDQIEWRVEIGSLSLEPHDEPNLPWRGVVASEWYLNGERVPWSPRGTELPMWVLDAGLGQSCWALWDEGAQGWGW